MRTLRGEIISDWKHDGNMATLKVTVPANSTAKVHIPAGQDSQITEGNISVAEAEGVELLGTAAGEIVFGIGSGEYVFRFPIVKDENPRR